MEKNNDAARNVVLHKSNKRNAAADNGSCVIKSVPRDHTVKKNMTYWDAEIKEKRRKEDD